VAVVVYVIHDGRVVLVDPLLYIIPVEAAKDPVVAQVPLFW